MKRTVVELFAGVGGFRVGLNDVQTIDAYTGRAIENRDWDFVWSNQWEPSTNKQDAYDCYCKRFGDSDNHSNLDISEVPKETIPNHSLLVGGFPCQDYSVARTLSGEKGIEGKKGVLFWQIAEILKIKKTPFVLLENVDRLLKSPAKQRGRDFGVMLRTFNDLDYNVEWRVINAADYGCAQRRRRVFIFAWKKRLNYNDFIIKQDIKKLLLKTGFFAYSFSVKDVDDFDKACKEYDIGTYEDSVDMTNNFKASFENTGIMIDGLISTLKTTPINKKPLTLRDIREETNGLDAYFLTKEQEKKFAILKDSKKVPRKKPNGELYLYSEGKMSYPDDIDLPGRTMLTSEASNNRSTHIIEDYETGTKRLLTPIEAERLQSFPDNWTDTGMSKNRRYFMMGNALVTKIINILESHLREIVNNEN